MKILVTGVAGAIGSHLAEELSSRGHEVVGIDSLTNYYDQKLKEINLADVEKAGAKVYRIDLAIDDLSEAVSGINVVYHLAAQPGISASTHFDLYVKDNVVAVHRLLEAVKDEPDLELFVNCSTSSVYGHRARGDENSLPQPISYYGVTKLAAEKLAMSYYRENGAMPVTSSRLFSVYGERERPEKLYTKLIKNILNDKEFPLHEGSEHHLRSYTYVGDAVKGFVLMLEHLEEVVGEIFNIGSDNSVTTGEGIKIIEELIGKKAKFKMLPRRKGDVSETHAHIDKARRILGYNPGTPLREGLRKQIEWYINRIHNKFE